MKKAIICIMPAPARHQFFLPNESHLLQITKVFEGMHVRSAHIAMDDSLSGEDIAEELFDLTNHPGRQEEREEKYGNGTSLSCGDMVEVIGEGRWVCLSVGWAKLPD